MSANKLYWLAYCDAIKKEIGETGGDKAIFYSTKCQRGPPVGCDPAYTNYGIYQSANNLLAAESLFYAPSATTGYVDSLETYLSWVNLGGDPSPASAFYVEQSKKTYDDHHAKLVIETKKVAREFNEMNNMGMIPQGQKLSDWARFNTPGYMMAQQSSNAAFGAYENAVARSGGALSGQWSNDLNKLNQVSDGIGNYSPGLTMPISSSTPPSVSEIVDALSRGSPLPGPADIVYYATYNFPDYASAISEWQEKASNAPQKTHLITLSLDRAKDVKEDSFGQTKLGGSLSFNYQGAIGFVTTDSSDEIETLDIETSPNDVSINLFYDATALVSITPGTWDLSNPKGTYPELQREAPDSVKILVRPSKLLLVSKLGYSINFRGSIAATFDNKVSEVTSRGGFVSVFGTPVAMGIDGSTNNDTTHVGKWDSANGTFEVTPTANGGFATVVAVVGEKLQTS